MSGGEWGGGRPGGGDDESLLSVVSGRRAAKNRGRGVGRHWGGVCVCVNLVSS